MRVNIDKGVNLILGQGVWVKGQEQFLTFYIKIDLLLMLFLPSSFLFGYHVR